MYDIGEIRTQLIDRIQSFVGTTPIVICASAGAYNVVSGEWDILKCNDAIESVYTYDWYVCFKICQLNPDNVYGYYESEHDHATDNAEYEGLSLEALYGILNYIEQKGIQMPRRIKNYRNREDLKLE